MARKRDYVQEQLTALAALGGDPDGDLTLVGNALASPVGMIAAKAASLVAKTGSARWHAPLVEVFDRFMKNPVKTDSGCLAKVAAVRALSRLDYDHADVFLRGVKHVQPEPVWGGTEDTAAELRGLSLGGLVSMGYADVLLVAVPLLVDPEPETRALAAQALGRTGTSGAEPLLRLKALSGEKDSRVLGESLAALMRLNPNRSLSFVAYFLNQRDPDKVAGAALALAESGDERVFPLLKRTWQHSPHPEIHDALLAPMALVRTEEAFSFLLEILEQGRQRYAREALRAMRIFRTDNDRVGRMAAAISSRTDATLEKAFQQYFP